MKTLACGLAVLVAAGASAATLENEKVRVEIGGKGELKALVCKATGHDWAGGAPLPGLGEHVVEPSCRARVGE